MPTTIDTPKTKRRALPEHACVSLRRDVASVGLKAGAEGTIVFVYAGGEDYEVEFLQGKARPIVLTVEAADISAIGE